MVQTYHTWLPLYHGHSKHLGTLTASKHFEHQIPTPTEGDRMRILTIPLRGIYAEGSPQDTPLP